VATPAFFFSTPRRRNASQPVNAGIKARETGKDGLSDRGREKAGALVPLELALHQLKSDHGAGAELRRLLLQLVQRFVIGLFIHALDACVDDAEFGFTGALCCNVLMRMTAS
jgi:hypothetical protein